MKIIINADDLGYNEEINRGIYESYTKGIVSSTTIMTNMPGFDNAVKLFKNAKDISIGIHFNLTKGVPIGKNYIDITNKYREFKSKEEIGSIIDLNEVIDELNLQLKKFIDSFNYLPSHIDSHHHIHTMDKFKQIFFNFAKKNNLPIRINSEMHKLEASLQNIKTPDVLITDFFNNPSIEVFKKYINKYKNRESIIEFMVHPGYVTDDLIKNSTYSYMREKELEALIEVTQTDFYKSIKNNIVNYNYFKWIH
ncbi:MAG: ChbG/HpnK family deacetylase [Fusobacteria bacterium]|nr:ChbG/HpnK family deacetylase [Fusobacteriota bacterium]